MKSWSMGLDYHYYFFFFTNLLIVALNYQIRRSWSILFPCLVVYDKFVILIWTLGEKTVWTLCRHNMVT